ncbi:hypothetical protein GGR52DRAFT_438725 [Hypoxylon sp. FL1284]|nr:hypothetical protein GGR52DRAFT_438725 [Hypoxylon sp. FL1284]
MLLVILTLLCVVASLSQAVESVGAEYRPDRFSKRILARNDSVTVVITSSVDIQAPGLTALSSEAYHGSIDTISAPADSTSTNSASAEDESVSSASDTWWTLFNLGTITTIRRPTLSLPTSTPIRIQPGLTSDSIIIPPYLPPTSTSFAFNATSRAWGWNTTSPSATLTSSTATTPTPSECPQRDDGRIVVTSYFVTHTSTTTWLGDPADYRAPYPSVSIPIGCTPAIPTGRFTVTFCDSTGQSCTFIHTTATETTTGNNLVPGPDPTPTETVTFTTTDKNPAVVFPTEAPPSYGGSPADPPGHNSAGLGDDSVATPEYGMLTSKVDSAKSSPTPSVGRSSHAGGVPITVIAQPGGVVIDDHTYTDNPTQKTSTVVVGRHTFVIEPSKVVGAGVTVTRPPTTGDVAAPFPTASTTVVGGIGEIVYGTSVATIDGTVFTIEPTPTIGVVRGQTITLGPEGIIFPSKTLHAAAGSGPTQTAVMGGELITAIGTDMVVIEGTTITYGHGSSNTMTTVVDGETVVIAPTGVLVHDWIIGGVTAAPTATEYEMVGGATVTQLGLTAVEIGGKTFHIGFGASTAVTTVFGGHTLTIGPKGVGMSTWTISAPHATTTTITPGGSNNNAAIMHPTTTATAKATASAGGENSASTPRRDQAGGFLAAVGAVCLGPLLFWP